MCVCVGGGGGGRGCHIKKIPSVGEVWIFYRPTHSTCTISCHYNQKFSLDFITKI